VLLDLVFPRRCVVCGADGAVLCQPCEGRLERLGTPHCERCGAPTAWPVARCRECAGRRIAFARARAAVAYDDAAKRLVGAWKERGQRTLAELAAEIVDAVVARPSAHTLTFVPADHDRLLRRGHNPAQRLAESLGRYWQLPVVPLLRRKPGRAPQKGLTLAERRALNGRADTQALLGDRVWPQKRRGARGPRGAQPAGVTSTPVTDGVTVR
jgi:predicted amidophosphoribosyltransferase